MDNKTEAKKLLLHYFKVAKSDLDVDCHGEIECIIDLIIGAVIDEIRKEKNTNNKIIRRITMLEQLETRYDPENDMRPDGPPVTWAEYDLFLAIKDLSGRVEVLEAENKQLKQRLYEAITLAGGESIE